MSYSQEQKIEIIEYNYKSSCCRRSLLCGILFAKGVADGKRVTLNLEKTLYAEFAARLIREFYSKEADIYRDSKGGRTVYLSFDSPSASKYITKIDDCDEYKLSDIITQKCIFCLPSFLRGVLLGSGRISDPQKQFSLEFTLGERCRLFAKILKDLSLNPLLSETGDVKKVYFHKEEEIESFFGHAGLNRAVFDVIETRIKTLARRESQRYINCVTSNYGRMAAVSERQIGIISRLEQLNLLSSLPEELEETARLKLRYPDLPLSALAAQMTPAISKSGLSHRLKKIEEVGARLLKITD